MITLTLSGLDETIDELRRLPTSIDRVPAFTEVASEFAAILRAATPPGYSRRLPDSVIEQVDETSAVVGYDERVETAGNPQYDSAVSPRTRGRSVLRRKTWVRPDELTAILEDTFDAHADRLVSTLEERLADGIS